MLTLAKYYQKVHYLFKYWNISLNCTVKRHVNGAFQSVNPLLS